DGMCWPLHIFRKNKVVPNDDIIDAILESKDCVALTILNSFIPNNEKIKAFANTIVNSDDLYEKDRYWLLLYQLFLAGDVNNAYKDKKVFEIMKSQKVDFLPDESQSEAELVCETKKLEAMFNGLTGFAF
ncbi:TPA: antiviral reverse transcriptase Drt4, partial [Photobacterium damselae]